MNGEALGSDLAKCLLVYVARRLGPALDRIEPQTGSRLRVVELVEGVMGEPGVDAGPAEVRAAVLDLVDSGLLGRDSSVDEDPDLLTSEAVVGLRVRGLRVAREVEPGLVQRRMVVRLRSRVRGYPLAFRFDTGDKGRDVRLNRSGLALSVFLVVGSRDPRLERPMTMEALQADCEKLTVFGIGPKFGKGDRLEPRDDGIRAALQLVTQVLPISQRRSPVDSRVFEYYLDGAVPEIHVRAPSAPQLTSWSRVATTVRSLLDQTDFVVDGLEDLLRSRRSRK